MTVYMLTDEGNEIDGVAYRAYSLEIIDGEKLEKKPINFGGTVGWDRLDFFREDLVKSGVISENTRGSILNGLFHERGSKGRLCKIADEDFERLIK